MRHFEDFLAGLVSCLQSTCEVGCGVCRGGDAPVWVLKPPCIREEQEALAGVFSQMGTRDGTSVKVEMSQQERLGQGWSDEDGYPWLSE